ncbi:MAG: PQQ-dependent sugar dehydrogenase, partial [Mammaliicoccus sciuri]|nr:PQQ-dependent sugar dehydrogenase [Mammaliicoccus sciuri]
MKRLMISAISASFILSACSNDSNEETEDKGKQTQNEMEHEQSQSDDNQERKETKGIETVAQGLDIPWSIARSDDVFYLSERPGKIIKIDGNKKTEQQVDLDKEVSTAAEAGLLGFVLAPDFKDSKEAYAYYTYEDNNQFNRIVKLKLENDTWKEDEVLIDKIPSGQYHHGGRLKIGPDDKLYATTGDASDEQNAQDKDTLGGKILRINL